MSVTSATARQAPTASAAPVRRAARRGPVGARPPRAAQPQRAHQEGRRRAQRPGPHRDHLRAPRLRQHRPGRPARPDALVGPLHPAQARASTAAARPCSSRTSSTTSTSCCASASTAGSSTWPSCARSPTSPPGTAADTADLTDRQNVQLHWVRIEDVPAIWRELEAVGPVHRRGVRRHPARGPGQPGRRDRGRRGARPDAGHPGDRRALRRRQGVLEPAPQVQVGGLVAARRAVPGQRHRLPRRGAPRARPRLRPVGRRRAVDQPDAGPAARRLGAAATRCPRSGPAWSGVFRDYGYRRLRSRARLKFLVADWGVQRFREVLEGEYLDRPLIDGPAPGLPAHPIDHIGVHRQRDGQFYVGVAPVAGRVSGPCSRRWPTSPRPTAAAGCGSRRTRSSSCSTCTRPRWTRWSRRCARSGWTPTPSAWRRGTMACTGIEFCKLAIVETKARAADWSRTWRTGCANSTPTSPSTSTAARTPAPAPRSPTSASRASWCPGPDGALVEGFQVHLGGGLALAAGQNAGFGRKLRGLKTTAEELPAYVERVTRRYLAGRGPGESFAQWVVRAPRRRT